jgi:hypothetical protein
MSPQYVVVWTSLDLANNTLQILALGENGQNGVVRRLAERLHDLHIAAGGDVIQKRIVSTQIDE